MDQVTTAGEEHRDRQPRRSGRLDDHLQPDAFGCADQRRGLDIGQTRHGRPGLAFRDGVPSLVEHPHGMRTRDPKIDPDQPSGMSRHQQLLLSDGYPPDSPDDDALHGHGPKEDTRRPRLPLMCCKRLEPRRVQPLPSSGASVASQVRQSGQRGTDPSNGTSPDLYSTPPPRPAGMTMQPWNLSRVVDPRG